jgi:peptidoglycan/LPS O-acetylase OafA/YrhL
MNRFIPYFEFVAFLTSLLAFPVIRKSKYLRLFPVVLLVIVSVEVYQLFWGSKGKINAWIYNILIPLQHLLYLIILRLAVNKKRYKRFLLVSSIVLIAFCVITGFFLEENHFNVNAYCLGSVLIIIGILIKRCYRTRRILIFCGSRFSICYLLFCCLM